MSVKPFPYQIKGAKQIAKFGGRALLADDMGLGKSLQTLMYINDHPVLRPVIIICPASVKDHWERECLTHFNLRAEILRGTKPPKRGLAIKHSIVVINYDILWHWMEYLIYLEPQIVIIDECHMLGSRVSRRTKAVQHLCRGVPHIVCLSGTPLTNRPAELFPTLNLLRPDIFPNFFSYGMTFCGAKRAPWGWEFKGATRLKTLHKQLKNNLMIRRKKEDVLDQLPAKRRFVVPLEISKYREYKQALNDFTGWLLKNNPERLDRAKRAEALVKIGYLKRLAGELKTPVVIDWIKSYFRESEGKLVLFAVHHKVIDQIETEFIKECVVLTGETTEPNRKKVLNKFVTNKSTRLFIGNIQAAGTGVNGLQVADTLAFCEFAWTSGAHSQAEDRIHRLGQSKSASCYYLTAKNTIEEKIAEIIQSKQQTLNTVLDGSKESGDSMDIRDQLIQALYEEGRR